MSKLGKSGDKRATEFRCQDARLHMYIEKDGGGSGASTRHNFGFSEQGKKFETQTRQDQSNKANSQNLMGS